MFSVKNLCKWLTKVKEEVSAKRDGGTSGTRGWISRKHLEPPLSTPRTVAEEINQRKAVIRAHPKYSRAGRGQNSFPTFSTSPWRGKRWESPYWGWVEEGDRASTKSQRDEVSMGEQGQCGHISWRSHISMRQCLVTAYTMFWPQFHHR